MNVNIKPAATGMNTHTYRPITVASIDFGELLPIRVIECFDSDNWTKISAKGRLRLAPQVFPAYGDCDLRTAAFFVPEYQLIQQSSAFHSNMNTYKGKSVLMPWIYKYEINNMFSRDTSLSTAVTGADILDENKYDFQFVESVGGLASLAYRRLTKKGQTYFKLLKSLGYDFLSMPTPDSATGETLTDYMARISTAKDKRNVLPLLAYAKIFCDMFMNSHLYNYSALVAMLHHIHDCEGYSYSGQTMYNSSTGNFTLDAILMVLDAVCVPHERNMYLDAWDSPNSPTGVAPSSDMISQNPDGLISPYNYVDSTGNNVTQNLATKEGSILITRGSGGSQTPINDLSQLGINLLESFYRYVKRNNLFGSKAVQRVLARFGIKSDDYNSHYVHKLYEGRSPIDFSAVMSNTDNYDSVNDTGKTLASYAGYGVGGLNLKFNYKCSEFGYIIILSWIQCTPILLRGEDPSVIRMNPFDWYTPEYDGKTLRAIPQGEVSFNKKGNDFVSNGDDKIFGFTDIYEEYRHMKDSVVGDFITSKNAQNFLFARDLSYFRRNARVSMHAQLNSIQYFDKDGNPDMTNPFQMGYSNGDRFYLSVNFDISAKRHVMSKSQALDLNGEGDLNMPLGGTEAH